MIGPVRGGRFVARTGFFGIAKAVVAEAEQEIRHPGPRGMIDPSAGVRLLLPASDGRFEPEDGVAMQPVLQER